MIKKLLNKLIPKKLNILDYNKINFFRLRRNKNIYEIIKVIENKDNKRYFIIHNSSTGDNFGISESTFNKLFIQLKNSNITSATIK